MQRISTLSNPTGLIDIEKSRVSIVIDEAGSRLQFSLVGLDLSNLAISAPASVVVIARKGNGESRHDLGPVSAWNKGLIDITDLGENGVLSFRVLVVRPGSPLLVAAAENVRPNGLGTSESFIALEPAQLGEIPWEFHVIEQNGQGLIQFNKKIFQSAAAAEADKHFTCFVIPEAIRRLAEWHATHVDSLANPEWEPFKSWLVLHGIEDEPEEELGEDGRQKWISSVVEAFCDRFRFSSELEGKLSAEVNE